MDSPADFDPKRTFAVLNTHHWSGLPIGVPKHPLIDDRTRGVIAGASLAITFEERATTCRRLHYSAGFAVASSASSSSTAKTPSSLSR